MNNKFEVRYATNPIEVKKYDTEALRKAFLAAGIFVVDSINLVYSHQDRIIFGGAMPTDKPLSLEAGKEIGADYFLERREMGVINIGGKGIITLDGKDFEMSASDGIYIGMGTKNVSFRSLDEENPAKFYINSCPAHRACPTKHIPFEKANKVHLGDDKQFNKRTINQYVHPSVVESCQLVMGMTVLSAASAWNTMPCHTHDRRMEVYLYFNMQKDSLVFHFMGEKDETRHLVVRNEQAVISPSWSIHSGVGTASYTFIWGMCGENQRFDDMDAVDMNDLR